MTLKCFVLATLHDFYLLIEYYNSIFFRIHLDYRMETLLYIIYTLNDINLINQILSAALITLLLNKRNKKV